MKQEMTCDSFYDELLTVSKPGRYLGNEWNSYHKEWDAIPVHIALCYPETYEIGMSNLGLKILYELLNSRTDTLADRVYAPSVDFEECLRRNKWPLFGLETRRPLIDFDVIGFTLQHELTYTNVLNILDLGEIPAFSCQRESGYPLIIGGGPCALNPEPIAEFFDAIFVGEVEDKLANIVECIKQNGRNKQKLLTELTEIPGVYVPLVAGQEKSRPVQRQYVDIRAWPCPVRPPVANVDTVHARFDLEIARGCPHNCKFCQASRLYHPYRFRSQEQLTGYIASGIKNTGYDEIALLSLSTTDYPELPSLVKRIKENLAGKHVSISLPSSRPDRFSHEIAKCAAQTRKGGLTFAPEAGTERLRAIIGKPLSDAVLDKAVGLAVAYGWRTVKLYFMYGLPDESYSDIQGIINTIKELKKNHRGLNINMSLSPFIPKPHTPFEREKWAGVQELEETRCFLKKHLSANVRSRRVDMAEIEVVLARGDRKLSGVIYNAWKFGAKFDDWREQFRADLWDKAFMKTEIDKNDYLRSIPSEEPLPWEFVEI